MTFMVLFCGGDNIKKRGRNISTSNLKEIFAFLDAFVPETKEQERDLIILKYAYVDDLSGLAIARLGDTRIVGYGNRSLGKPLKGESIDRIIKSYGLEHEKRIDYTKRNSYERRKNLTNERQKGNLTKPYICGCCGSVKKLELHHIVPIDFGGTDDFFNLLYLCQDCHKQVHRNFKAVMPNQKV